MGASRERVKRAENALRDVLKCLKVNDDAADDLLRRFGSPGAVIDAGKHQLIKAGLTDRDALLISMLPDIIRHMERQRFGEHPRISTLIEAERYLSMRYVGMSIEKFYLLALDSSGKLIECVYLQSGNEDSAPFYLKHVLAEVVRTNARSVIISHNHPNSTPRPSQADTDCTLVLMESLGAVGAPLVDHLIMVGKRAVTMRGFGFVRESDWRNQPAGEPPFPSWLDGWSLEEAADALAMEK